MHKYIYNIYIYIICTNPLFLWLELLGWLPFFLDCVGFSLRRLQLFQSTHLFSFKLTVLCQINTLASDFHQFFQTSQDFPPIFGESQVTLNSYSRGADPLLFISVDPNSMPCLGTHRYVVGVGNPAIHLSFGDG